MTVKISIFSTENLTEWAGESIVERGRRYQKSGQVEELVLLPDGRIGAAVIGSRKYRVAVGFDENGLTESDCTCPCGFNCKHAVAAVLEYRHRLETGHEVPLSTDAKFDVLSWNDKAPSAARDSSSLGVWLRGQTVEELIGLLLDLCREHPGIAADLESRKNLESGNTKALMREIRQLARNLIAGSYWDDDDCYDSPDYSGLLKKIEQVLPLGLADELLSIMASLLEFAREQVQYESHNEEFEDVTQCYSTALLVLRASTLAPDKKLMWAIEQILIEDYGFADVFEKYLKEDHPPTSWSKVADELLSRLGRQKTANGNRDWERDQLSNMAIRALEASGRGDEIIPLCEREAALTNSYERLVQRLLEAGRLDDAEHYIVQGVAATRIKSPGTASSLRQLRVRIYSARKDWAGVLNHYICKFVESPSTSTYNEAKKAADTVQNWPGVRVLLLKYLQSGNLPWQQKAWDWPAPDQIELDRNERGKKLFPQVETLIEIALQEKDMPEVVKWHDRLPQKGGYYGRDSLELKIAEAVKRYDPERALAIWRKLAEAEIALTSPSAYQTAGTYLKKAGQLMADLKRDHEWHDYLTGLRAANSRKRRLMEVLDSLNA